MSFPQLRSGWFNPLTNQTLGQAYSLSAEAASFVWTGQPVTLLKASKLTADSGSWVWTGSAVTFNAGKILIASSGSFVWTGTTADLRKTTIFAADGGSFTWAGQDVDFITADPSLSVNYDWQRGYPRAFHPSLRKPTRFYTPVSYSLAADAGSYSWAGTDAALLYGREIAANEGTFTWAGTDAVLIYQSGPVTVDRISTTDGLSKYRKAYPRAFHPSLRKPIRQSLPGNYSLSADAGTFNWTGTDATLTASLLQPNISQRIKKPNTWPRHFAPSPWGHLTGVRSRNLLDVSGAGSTVTIQAEAGAFSWTGTAAILVPTRLLSAASGTFSWTGTAASLNYGKTLAAAAGSFDWTGTAAALLTGKLVSAASGSWSWTGSSVTLLAPRRLTADSGSYSWTGTAAALKAGKVLVPDPGDYEWLGTEASLIWSAQPQGSRGRMLLVGVG